MGFGPHFKLNCFLNNGIILLHFAMGLDPHSKVDFVWEKILLHFTMGLGTHFKVVCSLEIVLLLHFTMGLGPHC